MSALPNVPISPIPAATSDDLSNANNSFPLLRPIAINEPVDPPTANQQPRANERRTDTLRAKLNAAIQTINALRAVFLQRDGAAAGSVMTGDLAMFDPATSSRFRVRNVADGVDAHDAVTLQQLTAITSTIAAVASQLSAFMKSDGSTPMSGPLNLGGNRAINVGPPVNLSDLINRDYLDTALGTFVESYLARNGVRPMAADLNMDGHRIFGLPTIGYPVSPSDAVTKAYIDGLATAVTSAPPGFVGFYAGPTAPPGWLLCNGATYNKLTYPTLWSTIQNRYGGADPTFAVPDVRGRVLVGLDNLGGVSANILNNANADILGGLFGAENVALELNNLPSHAHAYEDAYFQAGSGGGYFGPATIDADNVLTTITKQTEFTGENVPHNNVQPSIALLVIIKC